MLFLINYELPFSIAPLTLDGCLAALICGFLIGIERQFRGKHAGIRTSILVCMGAYTFVSIGNYYQPENDSAMRVLGQVVSGIGFLGAGLIISKKGMVQGVTSAAIIWMLAGIGSLIAFNNIMAAYVVTFMAVIVLAGVTLIEHGIKKIASGFHKESDDDYDD